MTSNDGAAVKLTPRGEQILELAERGLSNDQIASELNLSEHTIKIHFNRIFKRLGVHNRLSAVHKWRGQIPNAALINQLRRSRATNQKNLVALAELIRLQTEVIELALQRRGKHGGTS